MKNSRLLLAIIVLSIISELRGVPPVLVPYQTWHQESVGQSFMFTRPGYQRVPMEQSLWHDLITDPAKKSGSAFQMIGFYQNSRQDEGMQARYFLINFKNNLLVAGDDAPSNTVAIRDVRAEWLNLPSTFQGTMSLNPQQRQAGVLLQYKQGLGNIFGVESLDGYWVGIEFPFVNVENNLNLMQSNIQNPVPNNDGSPNDIIQAFNQSAFLFGKMQPCAKKQWGLGEFVLKFGKTYMSENNFQIAYYSLFRVPGSTKQNPEFVFDPVVGHNEHYGFGSGVNFQVLLNEDITCFAFCFYFDAETTFFFHNYQKRSFDIRTKFFPQPGQDRPFLYVRRQWSRYMQYNMLGSINPNPIPGINILTRGVRVRPYNMGEASAGLRIMYGNYTAELGYNLWAHGSEKIRLNDFALPNVYGIAGTAPGATASQSTIWQQAADDTTFIPFDDQDIDLTSGASRSAVTHSLIGSLGMMQEGDCVDMVLGAGFYFEFTAYNTAMKNLGGWAKIGASF